MSFKMSLKLKQYFEKEIAKSSKAQQYKNVEEAWYHLERAHILGQDYPCPHLYIHFQMLKLAYKQKDMTEMLGQLLRFSLVIPGLLFGKLPRGNTGRANVPLMKAMSVPEDLQKMLNE